VLAGYEGPVFGQGLFYVRVRVTKSRNRQGTETSWDVLKRIWRLSGEWRVSAGVRYGAILVSGFGGLWPSIDLMRERWGDVHHSVICRDEKDVVR
jgi:hypothetical protein